MNDGYFPDITWESRDVEQAGIDGRSFIELDSQLQSRHVNGIVVVHGGYIAFERYYNGSAPDSAGHVASVTKSVLSALIGIAIDKGFIASVDLPVLDFFPEYRANHSGTPRESITIRHLLTMTAPYDFEDWREPLDRMCVQDDWPSYILGMMGRGGSVGHFKYSSAGAHLLSVILTRASGQSAREFANEQLFGPIGMRRVDDNELQGFGFEDLFGAKVSGWVKDRQHNSVGGWGLTLTVRDMARFGLLYLRSGSWKSRAVLPEAWVGESTERQVEFSLPGGRGAYGYLWWLRDDDLRAYAAMGDGGSIICCLPDHDVVVAVSAESAHRQADPWELITRYIEPIFSQS